jgi:hypothetical protein
MRQPQQSFGHGWGGGGQQCLGLWKLRNAVQIEYPISEMFGTRSVSGFRFFWIMEYYHILCQLSVSNPQI